MSKLVKNFLGRAREKDDLTTSPLASNSSNQQPLPTSQIDDASSFSPTILRTSGVPRQKIGLFELSKNGERKTVDVVAVHGLQGDAYMTWEHDNGSMWLRGFLPADIPFARIMTFGYDSTIAFSKSVAKIEDKALELLNQLSAKRSPAGGGTSIPIVFVCHSLGGIVVKKALILAHERSSDPDYKDVLDNTKAIAFLGVPHKGSDSAWWATFAANALKGASMGTSTNTSLVADLKTDSTTLSNISKQFVDRARDLIIYTFYETEMLFGVVVVDERSALIGLPNEKLFPVNANHRMICKISSSESHEYDTVCLWIAKLAKRVAEEAVPEVIAGKKLWEEQDRIRKAQANVKEDFTVPFSLSGIPEIENFVGRKEELAKMKEAFQGDGSQRTVVLLYGLGGIGKTQLALTFVKEHRNTYSAIFWLNGKNEDTLKQSFEVIANRLYKEYPSSPLLRTAAEAKDVDQIVVTIRQWLSAKGNHRWMLVFDNIDNPKVPGNEDPQAYDVRLYFPEAYQGSLLITTRSSRLKFGNVVSVRKLVDIQESIAILTSTSGRVSLGRDPYAIDLANQLDGLPLALTTAGAYLSQVSTSLKDYLRHYRTSWLKLQQTSPDLLSYEDRTLYTTWNLSFKHIQSQNKSAENLLRFWAYFDNQDVWFQLLAAGSEGSPVWFATIVKDELSFNEAIRLLCDHALIESLEISGGYGMHNCVHAWAAHVLNAEREISMARLALICVGLTVPTKDVPEYWEKERRLLPHAEKCFEFVYNTLNLEFQDNSLDAVHNLGSLYADQGKMAKAEAMYRRALEGKEKAWGLEHTSTLGTVNNLVLLYKKQGKMAEAEVMFRRVRNEKP